MPPNDPDNTKARLDALEARCTVLEAKVKANTLAISETLDLQHQLDTRMRRAESMLDLLRVD